MKKILILCLALLLAACQTNPRLDEGRKLIAEGHVEEGLALLEQAARANPRNTEAYNAWVTQRETIIGGLVREGDLMRNRGDFTQAEWNYRRALSLDPTSAPAQNGLQGIERERRHQLMMQAADEAYKRKELAKAEELTRAVLKENADNRAARSLMKEIAEQNAKTETATPQLKLALNKPITLEFRDAPLRSIFEVISRSSGINFVFDRDVRQDLRATIFMRNTNLDEVIRILLTTNQLGRKVLNENSILIFPNTPAKQKDYQDLAVRSFYLANADVKQTAAMIRALVKTRDLYIDEKLNLLVMKDTPEAIRLAEQLVMTQDLSEPEVVLELEVLEVASSLIRDFGLQYPESVNWGIIPTTSSGTGTASTTFTEVKPRNWDFYIANPAMILNLRQRDGAVNTLANPRIRVRNREKAKIHIGEKVPVITSTSTANVGVSSSVNYLEVGLKLDVEPNVHLDNEVAMKVQLEVSNILEEVRFQDTISYRLGTRNATTVLRLRDGDTQVLAGLINDEDRRAANKVPYLGDFPLLGRLFRSDNDQVSKTEIVLLITPRIVRNVARPDTVRAQFSSGTDSSPGSEPLRLSAVAPGSFGMAVTNGGGATRDAPRSAQASAPMGASAPAGEEIALAMSGPSEVSLGEEFVVSFGLPMRAEGANAQVQLGYDANVLTLVSGAQGGPGRATVEVVAPSIAGAPAPVAQVRFRATAKAPTTGQIVVENVRATDNAQKPVNVVSPGVHFVAIGGSEAPAAPNGVPTPPTAIPPVAPNGAATQ